MGWFDVDRKGLAKLLKQRDKSLIIIELLQNAWDADVTSVHVHLDMNQKESRAYIKVIDDDPNGFADLAHAFTLFAESDKKKDPNKRGRFNLGEKLVLSLCYWANIVSTTGSYSFNTKNNQDVRSRSPTKTSTGSYFEGELHMTDKEYLDILAKIDTLIPPKGITTYFNGIKLKDKTPIVTFKEALPTEIADEHGILRKTTRKTTITLYNVGDNDKASIYEMGIPVVETGDKYHININQKVPLNFNRDNVTPSYLKILRTIVFNHTHTLIDKEDANASWVREATSNERCTVEAMTTAITHRFGEKTVAFDPSDPEANKLATVQGYTIIPGRSLNKAEWANIKRVQESGIDIARPSGQVTPSPKPFSKNGKPLKLFPIDKYTDNMHAFCAYAKWLAYELIESNIMVVIANDRDWGFNAAYGDDKLIVNIKGLGHKWFADTASVHMNALLLHEFAHKYSNDHLSSDYYEALCTLGAKLAKIAAENPIKFKK